MADVWIFNVAQGTWSHASPSGEAPPAREMHSGSMVSPTSMMVYGGRAADGRILCDVVILDASKMRWTATEPMPFSRCAHTGVSVSLGGGGKESSAAGVVM